MRTTIVIATRNGGVPLLRTLRCLESLTPQPPIIVVDNGSDDGTPIFIRECHPNVRVIRIGCDLGAYGRNLGVAKAKTLFVALASDDSRWSEEAIARAEAVMDSQETLGLIGVRYLPTDGKCENENRHDHRWDQLFQGVDGSCVIVRRDAFLQAGGFQKSLRSFGQEALLVQDLAAHGWGVAYVDDSAVDREHASRAVRPTRRTPDLQRVLLGGASALKASLHNTWINVRQGQIRVSLAWAFVKVRSAFLITPSDVTPRDVHAGIGLAELVHKERAEVPASSTQVRPHLQIVPTISANLSPADDALEEESSPVKGALLSDVRDVG